MYFKLKSSVIFRNYESFGYITDNRNFGYKNADINQKDIGDKIVSSSGALFLSILNEKPQALGSIANKISNCFHGAVDIETIVDDIKGFYGILEEDGFILSSKTPQECDEKDVRFSYDIQEKIKNKNDNSNNTNGSAQEFLSEYFNSKPQLTSVHIELTSVCNERCVHCYLPRGNKANHMRTDLFYDILKQCKEMKVLHLTLTGGEPMLHGEFIGFLKKCKEYNMSVNILSNLTILNDEVVDEIKNNHLISVQVSVYSLDSQIHDSITRTKGSLDITKKAIMRLKENGVPVQISCPIINQNKNSYEDVLVWARSRNINVSYDYVIIARCDNKKHNLVNRLSIADVKNLINEKIANEPKYYESMVEEAERKSDNTLDDSVCSVCSSSICITNNGNVYPCAGWQGYVVGSLYEKSLKEIWNSSEKVVYLRSLKKRDFPKCLHCLDKDYCTMCMVRNANEDPLGSPLAVNEYFCNIARINKEIVLSRRKVCGNQ